MNQRLPALATAAVVVLLDRVTKVWIERSMELYSSRPVIPGFFDLVYTRNDGMVFGLFAGGDRPMLGPLLVGLAVAVLLGVFWLVWKLPSMGGHRLSWLPLGLVFGGAVGNLYDRVVHGSVTDFLDFYIGGWHWPAFNVADSALTTGALLLAIGVLWEPRRAAME
jgi:signal peptidase II